VAPNAIPFYALESQPGDVVMFDQCTWHASFGGRTGRRMFTFNYSAEPTRPEHEAVLRKMYTGNVEATRTMQYTHTGRIYTDEFLFSDHPRCGHGRLGGFRPRATASVTVPRSTSQRV
jgi:hypothetical protein